MLKWVEEVGTYNPNGSNTRNVKEGVGKQPHK
jgi:ribosomal protein S16